MLMKNGRILFLLLTLFLISSSLLMLQILLTRYSRIAYGLDFRFLIISGAISGIGLGGLIVYFFFNKNDIKKIEKIFLSALILYSLFILLPFFILHNSKIFQSDVIPTSVSARTTIHAADSITVLFFISIFLTFLFGGILISFLFRYYAPYIRDNKIPLFYFMSLAGSAFGAFFAVLSLELYGVLNTLLLTFLFSVSSVILYGFYSSLNKKYILLFFLILLFPIIFQGYVKPYLQVTCSLDKPFLFSMSNSFSQIDAYNVTGVKFLIDDKVSKGYNPEELTKFYVYNLRFECLTDIQIINFTTFNYPELLKYYISNFPFTIQNYSKVLIIGSGSGNEVAQAILSGSPAITAIEINPNVIKAVNKLSYANPYKHPSVKLLVQEGRNFIATTKEKYDLIYIPTAKFFGSTGVSAFALSENYLYTKEAFNAYIDHLTDNGVLSFVDYTFYNYPFIKTLHSVISEKNVSKEIIFIEKNDTSVILYKKTGFPNFGKNIIINNAENLGFKVSFLKSNGYFYENFNPIVDDKPYLIGLGFLNLYKDLDTSNKWLKSVVSSYFNSIYSLIGVLLFVYFLVVLIPFRFKKNKFPKYTTFIVGFFSSIGLAYIIVELVLVEKITLLLGHPIFSLSLVLSSILFFGGIGSLLTKKFNSKEILWGIRMAVLLISILLLYLFTIDSIIQNFQGNTFSLRLIISIAILFFPSLLMGMLFPSGLTYVNKINKFMIPWMFGIDGITSLIGGVGLKIISLFFGFKAGLFVGIFFYVLATYFLIKLKQKKG